MQEQNTVPIQNMSRLQNIETERLTLIPVTLEVTTALLKGDREIFEKIYIKTHDKWPTEDTMDILPMIHATLVKTLKPSGFEFWMIVNKETHVIIGDIGFHGQPDENGVVEIGFGFVENERQKGYGFEATQGIMMWLAKHPKVKMVKADCLIDNVGSKRILEKIGMREVTRNEDYIFWETDII